MSLHIAVVLRNVNYFDNFGATKIPLLHHQLRLTSRGALGVINHTRTECKRTSVLMEFGHAGCTCIDVFRKVRERLRGVSAKGLSDIMLCYDAARLSGDCKSVPGIGRLYLRWRKRHQAEMDRIGTKGSTDPWRGNTQYVYELGRELLRRGHHVSVTHQGQVLEVSLGSRLTSVRVEVVLDYRSKRYSERWKLNVRAAGEDLCRLTGYYTSKATVYETEGIKYNICRTAELLERAVFAAYLRERGLKWGAESSESRATTLTGSTASSSPRTARSRARTTPGRSLSGKVF